MVIEFNRSTRFKGKKKRSLTSIKDLGFVILSFTNPYYKPLLFPMSTYGLFLPKTNQRGIYGHRQRA